MIPINKYRAIAKFSVGTVSTVETFTVLARSRPQAISAAKKHVLDRFPDAVFTDVSIETLILPTSRLKY